jgi:hypothetical protein
VQRHQEQKWAKQDQQRYSEERRETARATDLHQQQELEAIKAQLAMLQAQQTQAAFAAQKAIPAAATPGGGPDLTSRLQRLGEMREAGILNDDEFVAAKAKVLGS